MPVQDEGTDANAGNRVTMHCKFRTAEGTPSRHGRIVASIADTFDLDTLDDTTGNWTQSVLINGQEVSTLSTSTNAEGLGWGSAVECGAEDCGTMPAHSKFSSHITTRCND